MKSRMFVSIGLLVVMASAGPVWAAFIVEPHSSGRGFSNFAGTPRYSTTPGKAPGLQGTNSAYGSTTAEHEYVFSYTPGASPDNWDTPNYQYFGNGFYTTNLMGGQTGYYNVYITWPATSGMTSYCNLAITHEGLTVMYYNLDMNSGGTSTMAETTRSLFDPPPPDGTVYLGGNDAWLRIASNVLLNADTTYTVTQTATTTTWTSMRSAGVMWEFVAIPEPTTLILLGLGALGLRKRS